MTPQEQSAPAEAAPPQGPEMVTLQFAQHERDAVRTLLHNINANRVIVPMLRQLAGDGPVTVPLALAQETLKVLTDVLNRGTRGELLVALSDAEATMLEAVGPVPPIASAPAGNRKQRRASKKAKVRA